MRAEPPPSPSAPVMPAGAVAHPPGQAVPPQPPPEAAAGGGPERVPPAPTAPAAPPDAAESPRLPRWVLWLAVAACGAVFGLYLQPGFLFTLANQVWACF